MRVPFVVLAGTPSRLPTSPADLIGPELCERLDTLDLVSRKVFSGKLQGERRSKRRGRSVEFQEHREYVPGDDLRHIDWNVFARFDRLVLKLFQEEEDLSLILVLDASASMLAGSPLKLLTAARVAMALGYLGLVRNNRVSAVVVGAPGAGGAGGSDARLVPQRGRASVQRLGTFLIDSAFGAARSASASAGRDGADGGRTNAPARDFTSCMRSIATSRQGKGVLVLLSDLLIPPMDGYQAGLRLLAAPGGSGGQGAAFDVFCVQVLSPGELDPAKEGRGAAGSSERGDDTTDRDRGEPGAPASLLGDLALTDVETGRAAEVTITPALLDSYRGAVKRFVDRAAAFCTARGMGHLLVPSDADVPGIVLDTLRRRGVVG